MQSFIGVALVVSEKNGYKTQTDSWIQHFFRQINVFNKEVTNKEMISRNF